MPLVRVLPSAQDEVNAAAFHPFKVGRASLPRRALRLSYHAEACRHISTSNCVQAHCMAEHCWENRALAASFQAKTCAQKLMIGRLKCSSATAHKHSRQLRFVHLCWTSRYHHAVVIKPMGDCKASGTSCRLICSDEVCRGSWWSDSKCLTLVLIDSHLSVRRAEASRMGPRRAGCEYSVMGRARPGRQMPVQTRAATGVPSWTSSWKLTRSQQPPPLNHRHPTMTHD